MFQQVAPYPTSEMSSRYAITLNAIVFAAGRISSSMPAWLINLFTLPFQRQCAIPDWLGGGGSCLWSEYLLRSSLKQSSCNDWKCYLTLPPATRHQLRKFMPAH